jgi:hypothetical protein
MSAFLPGRRVVDRDKFRHRTTVNGDVYVTLGDGACIHVDDPLDARWLAVALWDAANALENTQQAKGTAP